MQKVIAFVLMATLAPVSLGAKPAKYVRLGVSISSFRMEEEKSRPGACFGLGSEYHPLRSFRGFLAFELLYVRKRLDLQDRTWPTTTEPLLSDVNVGDIYVDISYLEMPVSVGYSLPLGKRTAHLQILLGFSVSAPIKSHTSREIHRTIVLPHEEKKRYRYDYGKWEEMSTTPALNVHYGVRVAIESVGLDVSYARALNNTEGFTDIAISDKLDCFYICLSHRF